MMFKQESSMNFIILSTFFHTCPPRSMHRECTRLSANLGVPWSAWSVLEVLFSHGPLGNYLPAIVSLHGVALNKFLSMEGQSRACFMLLCVCCACGVSLLCKSMRTSVIRNVWRWWGSAWWPTGKECLQLQPRTMAKQVCACTELYSTRVY